MQYSPEDKNTNIDSPFQSHDSRMLSVTKEDSALIDQLKRELLSKNKEIERLNRKIKKGSKSSALKLVVSQLQDFMAMAPISIYFKNKNLEYTYANHAFAAWANIPVDELIGIKNTQLQIGSSLAQLEKLEREVIEKENALPDREVHIVQDDQQFLIRAYVFPMKDSLETAEGVMVCCFDLSDRLQFQKELKNSQEKAQSGIKSKQAFLANLSHEIRTPLHGIIGSGALLKSFVQDSQALDLLENINRSGTSLLEMVDSMLLFESLEKGEWELKNETFSLHELIQEAIEKYSDQITLKAIDIQSFIAQGLPNDLIGDVEKIKMILSIFLSNAVKFTNKGFVHLFVQAEHQNGGNIRLKFSIKDTGIGIKKNLQSDLFSNFTQGDSSSTKGFQGAGIGLAMAEKTVSYLGGSIGFESAEFKGSTFWFSVDLEKATDAGEITKTATPAQLPVLLVEDNKINQKIAFFTLKKLGFTVEIAENGLEAIERYEENNFKIVLMDIQMPIMNGFDATMKIRAIEKSKNLQPALIIALSANTIKEDVEKCFVVGMNEYISKPFSPDKLIEMIEKHIEVQIAK